MSIPVPDSYKNYMGTMGINTRSVIVATGIQGVKCSSVKGAAVRLSGSPGSVSVPLLSLKIFTCALRQYAVPPLAKADPDAHEVYVTVVSD